MRFNPLLANLKNSPAIALFHFAVASVEFVVGAANKVSFVAALLDTGGRVSAVMGGNRHDKLPAGLPAKLAV